MGCYNRCLFRCTSSQCLLKKYSQATFSRNYNTLISCLRYSHNTAYIGKCISYGWGHRYTDSCDIFIYKSCQNLNSKIVYFHYYGNLQQVTFWMLPKSGTTLFSKTDNFLFSLGLSRIIGVFPSGYFDILSSVILII